MGKTNLAMLNFLWKMYNPMNKEECLKEPKDWMEYYYKLYYKTKKIMYLEKAKMYRSQLLGFGAHKEIDDVDKIFQEIGILECREVPHLKGFKNETEKPEGLDLDSIIKSMEKVTKATDGIVKTLAKTNSKPKLKSVRRIVEGQLVLEDSPPKVSGVEDRVRAVPLEELSPKEFLEKHKKLEEKYKNKKMKTNE